MSVLGFQGAKVQRIYQATKTKCQESFAQIAKNVHEVVVFVHFIWLCAQKNVPLQRFSEKNIHF